MRYEVFRNDIFNTSHTYWACWILMKAPCSQHTHTHGYLTVIFDDDFRHPSTDLQVSNIPDSYQKFSSMNKYSVQNRLSTLYSNKRLECISSNGSIFGYQPTLILHTLINELLIMIIMFNMTQHTHCFRNVLLFNTLTVYLIRITIIYHLCMINSLDISIEH